jgi:hypothetical protein
MKILRVAAILVVAAVSLALLPKLQALPYFGLQMPEAPPTPPTPPTASTPPTPPAAPAVPAVASIDVVPEPPEAPEPPEPPAPPDSWSNDDGNKYVLSDGDMNVVNGDGDTDFSDLRHTYGRHFFWFRHDGHAYVVRDAATLRELADLYRPQSELGREQGELGRKQGALGRKQGELGREQGLLGKEQARVAMRFNDDDESTQSTHRELSRKQRELSRRQEELGREQSRLGEEQSRLGERQSALSRDIERKLTPMIEKMIRDGVAERAR